MLVPSHEVVAINLLKGTITLARLRKALWVWRNNFHSMMILSGGTVWDKNIQTKPLGRIMREWISYQLDQNQLDQIISEDSSLDSWQNAEFSLQIIEGELNRRGLAKNRVEIAVVTEPSQFRRIAHTIHKFGYPNVVLIDSHVDIGSLRRFWEWCLYLICLCDPKGRGWIVRFNRWVRSESAKR